MSMTALRGFYDCSLVLMLAAAAFVGSCHSGGSESNPTPGMTGGAGGTNGSTAGMEGGAGGTNSDTGGMSNDASSLTCGTSHPSDPLPIDASGWVPASSNPYCIQGEWSWYTDARASGKSVFTGLVVDTAPYVAGSGMCISGSTPGGAADNYATWGANISLNLNQSAPGIAGVALNPAPQCFTITITGSAPGGMTASLCPPTTGSSPVCPQTDVGAGTNEVCIDNVIKPSWCATASGLTCYDPSELTSGVVSVMVQGNAGATGGTIDFCVTSIVPHDHQADVDGGSDSGVGLPVITPGQIDPQVFGTVDMSKIAFSAFSVVGCHEQDPQVLDLAPDLVPRAWLRWDTQGLKSFEYDFTYTAACKAKGITFVSGTTASAFFQDEVNTANFLDQVSRDASGNPVVHTELGPNVYRASLASPAYRQRLIDIGKLQIDGGVDGVHFDEVHSAYTGANWNGGNEGFDDHGVADFGVYLCNKYAGSLATLTSDLGVTAADNLDCTGTGGGRNFDYRGYIARHGAQTAPLGSLNPLAPDWGRIENNRPDPTKGTFLETYPTLVYWQQIVVALRSYAREKYNREILISANGVYPFVDFQSIGIYDGNSDGPGGMEVNWVPVKGSDLDGTVSFKPALEELKARSKRILEATGGKEVPLLLFLDYATPSLDRYYALPLQERKDYFRLYAAEAYAVGIWFAVPLAVTSDTNTATFLGMMDFFKQLRDFYKGHADLYQRAQELSDVPTVSAPNVTTVLAKLPDGRIVLHIINHNYSAGVVNQQGVTVSFPVAVAPTSVTLVSPDFTADESAVFAYSAGIVTVTLGELDAYVAVVAR